MIRLGLLSDGRIDIEGNTLHGLTLDPRAFLPAAGQGAIAIECRNQDDATRSLLRAINHAETETRVIAERDFLRLLGAGCQTPVGAHTWLKDGQLHMAVRVFNEANLAEKPIELENQAPDSLPRQLSTSLAEAYRSQAENS